MLLQSDPLPIPAFFWNFPLECICYITIQPNCKVHLTYILSLTSPLLFVTNGLLVRGEIGEHTRNVRHNHYTPVLHDASLYTTSFQVCIIQIIPLSRLPAEKTWGIWLHTCSIYASRLRQNFQLNWLHLQRKLPPNLKFWSFQRLGIKTFTTFLAAICQSNGYCHACKLDWENMPSHF